MKKLIALLVLVGVVYVVVNRNRFFLRDPFGKVTRNGVKEDGAQVFINYSNDVLLENDSPLTVELVQRDRPVGLPQDIKCVHYVVCLMDAYPATLSAPFAGAAVESMDAKAVVFRDLNGKHAVVALR